jgi:hypothetical protein
LNVGDGTIFTDSGENVAPANGVHVSVYVTVVLIARDLHPPLISVHVAEVFTHTLLAQPAAAPLQLSPLPLTVQLVTLDTFQYSAVDEATRMTSGFASRCPVVPPLPPPGLKTGGRG